MTFPHYLELVPSPIALVTGANKGIGFEIARELAEGGCHVWLAGRNLDRVGDAAMQLRKAGHKADAVALDVTDPASVAKAAAVIEAGPSRLDILVNNAGIASESRREEGREPTMILPSELELDRMRRIYETNVFGPVAVTQAFVPLLRKSVAGRIVNVSSGLGSLTQRADPASFLATVNVMAYCSSKSALNAVTIAFGHELRDAGIKVNSADPGYCATDLNGHSGPRSAAQGAIAAVRLATLGTGGPTGAFYDDAGVVPW